MEHTARALTALSFSCLAFVALFHALVIGQVYPGNSGEFRVLSPILAGVWAIGIVEAWNSQARSAPFLALGYFAALGSGSWLALGGSYIAAVVIVAAGCAGLVGLAQGYFLHLRQPDILGGEPAPHLLKHAGGEETAYLRKTR